MVTVSLMEFLVFASEQCPHSSSQALLHVCLQSNWMKIFTFALLSTCRNIVIYRHSSWEINYGSTLNLNFNPVFTKFNFTEFLHTSLHQIICSTSRELVSSEWWRRGVFLAALCGNRLYHLSRNDKIVYPYLFCASSKLFLKCIIFSSDTLTT